jgi:hypothetical protein
MTTHVFYVKRLKMKQQTAPSSDDARTADPRALALEIQTTLRLCEIIGSSRSAEVSSLLSKDDWEGYLAQTIDPNEYTDPKRFAEDYLVSRIMAKSQNLPLDVDRALEARRKFFAAEQRNRLTNDRLFVDAAPSWVYRVSEELLHVLGPLTEEILNGIPEAGGFGPGACVGVRSEELVPSLKYDTVPVMTASVKPFFPVLAGPFVMEYWQDDRKVKTARGSHHFCVPKDATVDRNAAKEPLWNSYLQAGIGRHMEKRLRKFGVDVSNQGNNQLLASLAELCGLATIDLRQASDFISRMAVWLLLCANKDPQGQRWYHLLDLARSKAVRIHGEGEKHAHWHSLEMFSSMGNGFTFPLECCIFLAVVRSVVPPVERELTAVYGDDIILPQAYAPDLINRLEYLGFQVNTSKSCLAGSFFESCGTDWFKGQSVRPFFLRQDVEEQNIPYAMQIANNLRRWLVMVYGYCPKAYQPLWRWLKGETPQSWRLPVPESLGDAGLLSTYDEWRESGGKPHIGGSLEGLVVESVHLTPVNTDRRSFGVMCRALTTIRTHHVRFVRIVRHGKPTYVDVGTPKEATLGREPLRNQFGKIRTSQTVVPRWHDRYYSWY